MKGVWVRLHSNWNSSINLKHIILKNKHLSFEVPDGKICLTIRTREGRFGKTRWRLLPAELEWSKSKFLNAMGLFLAEGHTSKRKNGSLSHVAFTNSDFNLLSIWLNFFDKIVKRNNLKWFLNTLLTKNEIEIWKIKAARELGLNLELFGNWKGKNKSSDDFPVIRVYTCCILLRSIIENLLKIAVIMAKKDIFSTVEFLKGWWAGDGSIIKGKKKYIEHFTIVTKQNIKLAKFLFKNLGVSSNHSNITVFTNEGIENLTKLVSLGIASLRTKDIKQNDIITLLRNKPAFILWEETLPLLTQPLTRIEITKLLCRNKDCVKYRLESLLNQGLISVISLNKPKQFLLTEKGKQLIDQMNLIKSFD